MFANKSLQQIQYFHDTYAARVTSATTKPM